MTCRPSSIRPSGFRGGLGPQSGGLVAEAGVGASGCKMLMGVLAARRGGGTEMRETPRNARNRVAHSAARVESGWLPAQTCGTLTAHCAIQLTYCI